VTYTAAQLLGNDTDVDSSHSALSIASVTSGTGGTAVRNGDGSVTFTPNADFNGAAAFTYTAFDGAATSAPTTVTVNVTPPSLDGHLLQVQYIFGSTPNTRFPSAGASQIITVDANPGADEIPNLPFPDSGEIGNGSFGLASVDLGSNTIRLEFPLDPSVFPGGFADFASADPVSGKPYNGVLITDTTNGLPPILGVTIADQAGFGTPLNSSNITFTADSIFVNVAGNSRLIDSDPNTAGDQPSFVALNVDFNAPVAVNDTLTATEDTPVTYTAAQLLGNDTDVDNLNSALSIASVTSGTGGTAALNLDGSVTFTPNDNFNGAADFTYTVSDGSVTSNLATVTVNVAPVNDAPVAVNDTLSAVEDTPVTYKIGRASCRERV
jgi:VCBS repeat-containing protein